MEKLIELNNLLRNSIIDLETIEEKLTDEVMPERDTLKAEVERLKVLNADYEYIRKRFDLTSAKPVVWLRDGHPCDERGHRVDYDESISEARIESVREWLKDAATVRVWSEPEPEHEWIYGVWKTVGAFIIWTNDTWMRTNADIEGCIRLMAKPMPGTGGKIKPTDTPDFGVRLMTKRECEREGIKYKDKWYAAFRDGKMIQNMIAARINDGCLKKKAEDRCIEGVLRRLTPAVPARKLSDLEVAKS